MTQRQSALLLATTLLVTCCLPVCAQEDASPSTLRPRKLAPGVMTVIAPIRDEAETMTKARPLAEVIKGVDLDVLNWDPHYSAKTDTLGAKAITARVRKSVWYLEFSFKPLRMIYVDIPGPNGKLQRTPVWYMVYKVKNNGGHFNPTKGHYRVVNDGGERTVKWVAEADEFGHSEFGVNQVNRTVRFFPKFTLVAHDVKKKYNDQLVPVAIPAIQRREDRALKFNDSVEISMVDIPVSDRIDRGVWGVVTWVDIDPKIDFFSIMVEGLTNAYKYDDNLDLFTKTSPPLTGRTIRSKTLQLAFWRPGDEVLPTEREIHFGLPRLTDGALKDDVHKLYGMPEPVNYRWFYP